VVLSGGDGMEIDGSSRHGRKKEESVSVKDKEVSREPECVFLSRPLDFFFPRGVHPCT
jgi:hypothetical protein